MISFIAFCLVVHFLQANTDQDQPYWRGAIWININYLTVKALYHYGNTDGPYRERALGLYSELRYVTLSKSEETIKTVVLSFLSF